MQSNPRSFKKFKKAPFFLSVLLLALSSAGFFFLFQEVNENKKLTEEARAKWQMEEARRQEIRSLEIFLEDVIVKREEFDSHFARSSNIVPFLDSIEELARRVSAEPEVVSVDSTQDGQGLTVVVRASGSFGALYKFLELLENSPYELEFTTVDISKTSGAQAGKDWEAFFRLNLLSFLP